MNLCFKMKMMFFVFLSRFCGIFPMIDVKKITLKTAFLSFLFKSKLL